MGTVLEASDGTSGTHRVYVTGDTMLTSAMDDVHCRYPDIDTVVLHVGGTTLPGGAVVTMTGPDAAECLRLLGPRVAVPIHYDDYRVFKSGLDDVRRAVDSADLRVDMRYVGRGDTVAI
jgi:L-ascorbate metabolism protein UlaG (beta-lactamase superfamily)